MGVSALRSPIKSKGYEENMEKIKAIEKIDFLRVNKGNVQENHVELLLTLVYQSI